MIAVLQLDPVVPPGTLFHAARAAGVDAAPVRLHRGEPLPPLSQLAGAVVLGGTMGARDTEKFPHLTRVRSFLRVLAAVDLPVLGICLGAQLLASTLGASLRPRHRGERGIGPIQQTLEADSDPLFQGVPDGFVSFHWHDDSFDLPAGAVRLAHTEACPNQAFRVGRHLYGIQFHPEVDAYIVEDWAKLGAVDRAWEHLNRFRDAETRYRHASRRILQNFFQLTCPAPLSSPRT